MEQRPDLNTSLDSQTFRQFYYLKEELVDFCKQNHIPTSGGKIELTERIAYFLETGKIMKTTVQTKKQSLITVIHETDCIESNFVCSEKHRAFFKQMIGSSFSFNVLFQKWLLAVPGIKLGEGEVADLYEDGNLNVLDLAVMKQKLSIQ